MTHLDPARPTPPAAVGLRVEVAVVLLVTFGFSGLSAVLTLIQEAVARGGLSHQRVTLNPSRSGISIIDLAFGLLNVLQLLAWSALSLYLLWRGAISSDVKTGARVFPAIGLARPRFHPDVTTGSALAAVIGLPGLGLYVAAHELGFNVTVVPTTLHSHWWRIPMLLLQALANAVAEEVIVVGYLLTRLREIGMRERQAWAASALLRGSYHLYQGFGGGLGNVVMGIVFARYWQLKSRLWPLILAHATIDSVAYIGYLFLKKSTHWLP